MELAGKLEVNKFRHTMTLITNRETAGTDCLSPEILKLIDEENITGNNELIQQCGDNISKDWL